MKLPRRKFLHLAAGAAALPVVLRVAQAQSYPSRPVRLVVGFPASSATDIFARLMGQWLSERLGQQFLVENRVGAATNIATEAVVRAPPDGYTLLLVTPAKCGSSFTVVALVVRRSVYPRQRKVGPTPRESAAHPPTASVAVGYRQRGKRAIYRTHAPQQLAALFDHFVGAGKNV